MARKLDENVSHGPNIMTLTDDQAARSVLVSKIPRVTKKNSIIMRSLIKRHFEWAKNGGGKIDRMQFPTQELVVITFENIEAVNSVLALAHIIGGKVLELKRYTAVDFQELFSEKSERRQIKRKGRKDKDKQHPTSLEEPEVSVGESTIGGLRGTSQSRSNLTKSMSDMRHEQELEEMVIIVDEFQKALTEEQETRIHYAKQVEKLERDLAQMQKTLDDREGRTEELNGATEKKTERTTVKEKSSKARNQYAELKERLERDLAQTRTMLDDKERIVNELQDTLEEERRVKTALDEELNQVRISVSQLEESLENEQLSRQDNENDLQNRMVQYERLLEEERQQKTTLEERLRNLEDEGNDHLSEMSRLQSTVTTVQAASAESNGWAIQREEVILSDKELGRGAYGIVVEGTFRGCEVAVKQVHKLILSSHNRSMFEREMIMASRCRHPNLLQLIGATNDDDNIWFVTELLDISLRNLFNQNWERTNEEIVILAVDVAKGLNYLHLHKPRPILHRDISSANVLLWRRNETWRAKLSDYGSVNFMREQMTANPGASIYSAPEANTTAEQSPKMDVYSFGVLLLEMCTGELPTGNSRKLQEEANLVSSRDFKRLIKWCVKHQPSQRPDTSQVLEELCNPSSWFSRCLKKLK